MQDEDILLKVSDVKKIFSVKKEKLFAVAGVNLELHRGECLGIVGESGCGKSTLARVIAGIIPPSEGCMVLAGTDYTQWRGKQKREFRRNIQMVFQDPLSSFSPRMRIGMYLTESRRNFDRITRKEAVLEAEHLLEMVGLSKEYAQRFPHELSGGQLQRVAIARAMAIEPKLLICDEATGALDVSIQNQIARLLVELVETKNIGCLFIGHDLALVRSVSQRIAVMYLGRIVEILESETLSERAAHPYTRALLDSIFDVGMDQNQEITQIQGEPPSPLKMQEGCAFAARCKRCRERCRQETPALKDIGEAHRIACHNPF